VKNDKSENDALSDAIASEMRKRLFSRSSALERATKILATTRNVDPDAYDKLDTAKEQYEKTLEEDAEEIAEAKRYRKEMWAIFRLALVFSSPVFNGTCFMTYSGCKQTRVIEQEEHKRQQQVTKLDNYVRQKGRCESRGHYTLCYKAIECKQDPRNLLNYQSYAVFLRTAKDGPFKFCRIDQDPKVVQARKAPIEYFCRGGFVRVSEDIIDVPSEDPSRWRLFDLAERNGAYTDLEKLYKCMKHEKSKGK